MINGKHPWTLRDVVKMALQGITLAVVIAGFSLLAWSAGKRFLASTIQLSGVEDRLTGLIEGSVSRKVAEKTAPIIERAAEQAAKGIDRQEQIDDLAVKGNETQSQLTDLSAVVKKNALPKVAVKVIVIAPTPAASPVPILTPAPRKRGLFDWGAE